MIDIWPEHQTYLARNFKVRAPEQMTATELASSSILKLIRGDEERFARHYRWTCDRLNEEELFFHRNGRYRLSTFAEALAEVYSNNDYMTRYMDGLLLTQSLWFNHAATFEMFLNRLLPLAQSGSRYLEIGPGHGLMTYFAAKIACHRNARSLGRKFRLSRRNADGARRSWDREKRGLYGSGYPRR